MAQAAAIWVDTVVADWEAGDLVPVTNWLQQVLQNIEHLSQSHGHDAGTSEDGGRLRVNEAKDIWLLLGAS